MLTENNQKPRGRGEYEKGGENEDKREFEEKRDTRPRPPPSKRGRSPHHMGNSPGPSSGGYPLYDQPPRKRRKYDEFVRLPARHYDPHMQDFPPYHHHNPMYRPEREMYINPGKHAFYRDRPPPDNFPRGGRPPPPPHPRDRNFPRQPYMYRGSDVRPFAPPIGAMPLPYPEREYYSPRHFPYREPDLDERPRGRIRDRRRRKRDSRYSRGRTRSGRSFSRSPSGSSGRSRSRSSSRSPSPNSNYSGSRRSSRSRSSGSNRSATTSPDSKDPASSSNLRNDDSQNNTNNTNNDNNDNNNNNNNNNDNTIDKEETTSLRENEIRKEDSSPSSNKREGSFVSSDEDSLRNSDHHRSRRRHREPYHSRHRRYGRSYSHHRRYEDTRPHYRHFHYHRHGSRRSYPPYSASPGGRWGSDRYSNMSPFRKRYDTSPISRSRSRSNSMDAVEYRSPSDSLTPNKPRGRSRSPPPAPPRQGMDIIPDTVANTRIQPPPPPPLPGSPINSNRTTRPMPPPPPPPPSSSSSSPPIPSSPPLPPSQDSSSPSLTNKLSPSHATKSEESEQHSNVSKPSQGTVKSESIHTDKSESYPSDYSGASVSYDSQKKPENQTTFQSSQKADVISDVKHSKADDKMESADHEYDQSQSFQESFKSQIQRQGGSSNDTGKGVEDSRNEEKSSETSQATSASGTATNLFESSPANVSKKNTDDSQNQSETAELPSKAKLLESIRKLDVEISNVTEELTTAKQPVLKKTRRKKKKRRKRQTIKLHQVRDGASSEPMQVDDSINERPTSELSPKKLRQITYQLVPDYQDVGEDHELECMSFPEKVLYLNQQKAKQAESQLRGLTPPFAVSIYAQYDVSELSLIDDNNRKHYAQAYAIQEVVRDRHEKIKRRTRYMRQKYLNRWKQWRQKSGSNSIKSEQNRVRSEADYERVMARLQHEEETKARSMKTLAEIPRLLTPEEREEERFNDRNQLVLDSMYETQMRRIREEAWTSAEKQTFFSLFIKYPKDMRKIASFLPNKTTSDVVNFYYNHKTDPGFRKLIDDYQLKSMYRKIVSEGSASAHNSSSARMTSSKRNRESGSSSDLEGLVPRELRSLGVTPDEYATMNVGRGRSRSSRRPSNTMIPGLTGDESRTSPSSDGTGTLPDEEGGDVRNDLSSSTPFTRGIQQQEHKPKQEQERNQPNSLQATSTPRMHTLTSSSSSSASQSHTTPHLHNDEDGVRWTDDEKRKFIELLKEHGRNFEAISAGIRSKSQSQCKNYFHNNKKKLGLEQLVPQRTKDQRKRRKPGRKPGDTGDSQPQRRRRAWTDEERAVLLQCLSKFGPDWAKIGEQMPQKTRTQIRNYFAANKSSLCAELNQHPSTLTKKKPGRGRRPSRSRNTENAASSSASPSSSSSPAASTTDLSQLASIAVQGNASDREGGSGTVVKQENETSEQVPAASSGDNKDNRGSSPAGSQSAPTVIKQERAQPDLYSSSSHTISNSPNSVSVPAQSSSSSSSSVSGSGSSSSGFPTIRDLMARVMTSGSSSDANVPSVTEMRPPLSYSSVTSTPHGIPPPRQEKQQPSLHPSHSILNAPPLTAQLHHNQQQNQQSQQHNLPQSSPITSQNQKQNPYFPYQQSQQQQSQHQLSQQTVLPFPVNQSSSSYSSSSSPSNGSSKPKAHLSSISALLNSDTASAPEPNNTTEHPWLFSRSMFPSSATTTTTTTTTNSSTSNNPSSVEQPSSRPPSFFSSGSSSSFIQQQGRPSPLPSHSLQAQSISYPSSVSSTVASSSSSSPLSISAQNSSSNISWTSPAEKNDPSGGHEEDRGGNQHDGDHAHDDKQKEGSSPRQDQSSSVDSSQH